MPLPAACSWEADPENSRKAHIKQATILIKTMHSVTNTIPAASCTIRRLCIKPYASDTILGNSCQGLTGFSSGVSGWKLTGGKFPGQKEGAFPPPLHRYISA